MMLRGVDRRGTFADPAARRFVQRTRACLASLQDLTEDQLVTCRLHSSLLLRIELTHKPPRTYLLPPNPHAPLQELSEDQLVHVLTEPRHALCKQYATLLAMNGAKFRWGGSRASRACIGTPDSVQTVLRTVQRMCDCAYAPSLNRPSAHILHVPRLPPVTVPRLPFVPVP